MNAAMVDESTLTLSTLAAHFSDEDAAYELMEATRWSDGPICPHCGSVNHAYFLAPKSGARTTRTGKTTYRRLWKCGDCREQFSVLVGTIFEDSHISLSKWLLAIHLLCAGKNGVSALELSRTLGIAYRSAWFMCHRIRYAMARPPLVDKLTGTVEADETYVGGKHHGKRGRGAEGKTPVFTLVERDGEARSQVMKRITGENVRAALDAQVDHEATLMTDTYPVYRKPGKAFAAHEMVDHGKDEYAKDAENPAGASKRAHINTAEGYFSQLKRSIDGTYHHVSERHLNRYLAEFDYRYNTRKNKDGERTMRTIRQAAGKRLHYQEPVASEAVSAQE
ncbi:MAG: IS1595 family transposase [Ktedonobacterales bacterium]